MQLCFVHFFLTYFIEIIIKKMLITWKFKLQHVNFMPFIRLYRLLLGTVSRRIKCLLFHFHWNILIQNVDVCFPNINTSLNPVAVSMCVPAIFLGHPFPVLLGRTKGILCKFWRHNHRLLPEATYMYCKLKLGFLVLGAAVITDITCLKNAPGTMCNDL